MATIVKTTLFGREPSTGRFAPGAVPCHGAARGASVPRLFWVAAALTLGMALADAGLLSGPPNQLINHVAVILILVGGLPHGAFDLAVAARALRLSRSEKVRLLSAYVAVAGFLVAGWTIAPPLILPLFLAFSAVHFGEDWHMLDDGLLRVAAGASVIAIPAFFRTTEVTGLFVVLGGHDAEVIARIAVAAAPVTVLVAIVGVAKAFSSGFRCWALAQAISLLLLAVTPPVVGFTLYFVFLHSPLHLSGISDLLPGWSRRRLWIYGAAICAITVVAGVFLLPGLLSGMQHRQAGEAFRLLSIVAAPHLLLTYLVRAQPLFVAGRHP